MIKLKSKNDCCGCGACKNKCPKHCICMKADSEGFLYPVINSSECINCSLCENVCPIINHNAELKSTNNAYGAYNLDDSIRRISSSGGIFYLLAKKCIECGGVVAGAAFDKNFTLCHQIVSKLEQLDKLLGSKYVQSKTGDIYLKIKCYLDDGVKVLFSGTSCQVEALLSFLGKPYENLTTVDIICHGAPSPLLWEKYKLWISNDFNHAKIQKVSFRDKTSSWKRYSVSAKLNNKSIYSKYFYEDPFMRAFLRDYCLRPSCYSCSFKGTDRLSDITLGDFWGVECVVPELDDNKGTSLVITHSEKGEEAFHQVYDDLNVVPINMSLALKYNPSALYSSAKPKCRNQFMQDLQINDFSYVYEKYLKDSMFVMFKKFVKKVMGRGRH